MRRFDELLTAMIEDSMHADRLYRATTFWEIGGAPIVDDLRMNGVTHFREHSSARRYYAPMYGRRAYLDRRDLVERWLARMPSRRAHSIRWRLDGRHAARVDARLFRATDVAGGLALGEVSESEIGGGERFEIGGQRYSRSLLNYLRALTLLKRHAATDEVESALEIGGGYGTLGEILGQAAPSAFYVDVDIPPVAAVATYYLSELFGEARVWSYLDHRHDEAIDLDAARDRYAAVVLCPWQLPRVTGSVDLFVNMMSFQEMEPDVVANYIDLVSPRTRRFVVLRNSVTGKPRSEAGRLGVDEPVRDDDALAAFREFEVLARDAFVHGEESPDRSFRSEVAVLARNG